MAQHLQATHQHEIIQAPVAHRQRSMSAGCTAHQTTQALVEQSPKVDAYGLSGSVTPCKLWLIAKGQCLQTAGHHDTLPALGETMAKHHICKPLGSVNSCELQSMKWPKVNVCKLRGMSHHTCPG